MLSLSIFLSDITEEYSCLTSRLGSRTEHKNKTSHNINKTLTDTTGFKHRGYSVKNEGALPAKTCGMKR